MIATKGPLTRVVLLFLSLGFHLGGVGSEVALAGDGDTWKGGAAVEECLSGLCQIFHGVRPEVEPGTVKGSQLFIDAQTDRYLGRLDSPSINNRSDSYPWHSYRHRHIAIFPELYNPNKQPAHPEIIVWVEPGKNNAPSTINIYKKNHRNINIDEEILRLKLRLQELFPAGVLDATMSRPHIRVSDKIEDFGPKQKPIKPKGLKASSFIAPILVGAGASCSQAAGVDPGPVEDVEEAIGSVPLSPFDVSISGLTIAYEVYSENHALPGSKTYEMKKLAEAYANAPSAFAKATGISAPLGSYLNPIGDGDDMAPERVPASALQNFSNSQIIRLKLGPDGHYYLPRGEW